MCSLKLCGFKKFPDADDDIYGVINRPGGFELTEQGIQLCGFPKSAGLMDIGCGSGATVRFLAQSCGFNVTGVDIAAEYAGTGSSWEIITADAALLPFEELTFDGGIFECSLSKIKDPNAAISECHRVLKHGGKLLITDLYARGEAAQLSGMLGRLENTDTILGRVKRPGFKLLHIEDHSEVLRQMWAELISDIGTDALYDGIGVDAAMLKRIRCGYYMAVLEK